MKIGIQMSFYVTDNGSYLNLVIIFTDRPNIRWWTRVHPVLLNPNIDNLVHKAGQFAVSWATLVHVPMPESCTIRCRLISYYPIVPKFTRKCLPLGTFMKFSMHLPCLLRMSSLVSVSWLHTSPVFGKPLFEMLPQKLMVSSVGFRQMFQQYPNWATTALFHTFILKFQ